MNKDVHIGLRISPELYKKIEAFRIDLEKKFERRVFFSEAVRILIGDKL